MLAVRGRATGDVNVLAIYEERRIIATSGGILGSRTWTQIMSDALGKPSPLRRWRRHPAEEPPCSFWRPWGDRSSGKHRCTTCAPV